MSNRKIVFNVPLGMLGLTLVVLKLCGVLNLSWWVVTIPFWIGPVSIMLFTIIFVFIVWLNNVLRNDDDDE